MVLWKMRPPIAVVNMMIASTRTNVSRLTGGGSPPPAVFAPAPPPARSDASLPRPDQRKAA